MKAGLKGIGFFHHKTENGIQNIALYKNALCVQKSLSLCFTLSLSLSSDGYILMRVASGQQILLAFALQNLTAEKSIYFFFILLSLPPMFFKVFCP